MVNEHNDDENKNKRYGTKMVPDLDKSYFKWSLFHVSANLQLAAPLQKVKIWPIYRDDKCASLERDKK